MAVIDYRADTGRQAALAALRAELYGTEPGSLPRSGHDADRAICDDRRHFAVFAANRMLGHVTAFVNSDLQDRDGTPVGALGDFECVDDASVASELLGAAIHWLRTTDGRSRIWGPINFDIWNGYRFMTEGFDTCRFRGEPRNKPYYPTLFERNGFEVRQRWTTVEVDGPTVFGRLLDGSNDRYQQLIRDGYRFTETDLGHPADFARFHRILERSFRKLLGYTPITRARLKAALATKCRTPDPRIVTLIGDPHGRQVGFAYAYPDDNARQTGTGERRAIFYMLGIDAGDGAHNRGLGEAAVYHTFATCLRAGYRSVVPALMRKASWTKTAETSNLIAAQKAYALYEFNG